MTASRKNSSLISLALAALVLLVLVEWRPWQTSGIHEPPSVAPSNEVDDPKAAVAEAVPTEAQPIRAQLSPVRFMTVAAELGAKVQDIPFREGDSFKKGQRLIVFDCGAQKAQHDKATAALAIAERNYTANKNLLGLR